MNLKAHYYRDILWGILLLVLVAENTAYAHAMPWDADFFKMPYSLMALMGGAVLAGFAKWGVAAHYFDIRQSRLFLNILILAVLEIIIMLGSIFIRTAIFMFDYPIMGLLGITLPSAVLYVFLGIVLLFFPFSYLLHAWFMKNEKLKPEVENKRIPFAVLALVFPAVLLVPLLVLLTIIFPSF